MSNESEERKAYLKAYEASHPKCAVCNTYHIPNCVRINYEASGAYRNELNAWNDRFPNSENTFW